MNLHDRQDYGSTRQRGRTAPPGRNMATQLRGSAYSGETLQMRTMARRAPPRRHTSWLLVPLILIIILLAGALGGITWLDQTYAGRIYPHVSVQGVDVSEMTPAAAEKAIQARYDRFLAAPIRFEYADRNWEPRPDEIGFRVNVQSQVAEAMRAGRGNGLIGDLQDIYRIWQQGLDLPLRFTVDAGKIQAYIQKIGAPIEKGPIEASIGIDPILGKASSTDSAEGRMLLLDETAEQAIVGLSKLEPQTVSIHTRTLTPHLQSQNIADAKRTVDAMLQGPLELHFQDQTFAISQTEIADMITIARTDGISGPVLNAQLDQRKLKKAITHLADKIGRDSIEPRVAWNGGDLKIIREGRSAYRLNIDRAVELVNQNATTTNRSIDLPVDEVQPQATPQNLASLGIKELIATGRSDFTGSAAYRIANIENGVKLVSGILVPPDGEFAFNENVGDIDAAHGFVDGYAIVGNRTQLEPGGGICQVSTTLFRAAFYAGLPFTDWTPHRFRISWYEKYDTIGMDATIFTGGGPDLKFKNDTGNWILIEGVADEARALVAYNIYGTKVPGRTVERTDPVIGKQTPAPTQPVYVNDPDQPVGSFHQTDTARGGMDIEITRTIKQDGKVVRQTHFRTQFQSWPNIFVKNPKTPVPPGGKLGSG